MESWRVVKGFPYYEVSNTGKVRSKITDINLKQANHNQGYKLVCLQHRDGTKKQSTKRVHKLVAEAFLGPALGREVNHKDGNKANNQSHAYKINPDYKKNLIRAQELKSPLSDRDVKVIFRLAALVKLSQREIAEAFGVHKSTIQVLLAGKRNRKG